MFYISKVKIAFYIKGMWEVLGEGGLCHVSLGEGIAGAVAIAYARQMRPGDGFSSKETSVSEDKTAACLLNWCMLRRKSEIQSKGIEEP